MPTTPTFGLPYPAQTDPADVPTDMGELALAVDGHLGTLTDASTSLDTRVDTLETQAVDFDARLDTIEPKVPAARIAPGSVEGQVLTTAGGSAVWATGGAGSSAGITSAERTTSLSPPIGAVTTVMETPVVAFSGSPVIVTVGCVLMTFSGGGGLEFRVTIDGADVGVMASWVNPSASGAFNVPGQADTLLAVPAGNHKIGLAALVTVAAVTMVAAAGGAGAYRPMFIRVAYR